jgi:hypothetical protein
MWSRETHINYCYENAQQKFHLNKHSADLRTKPDLNVREPTLSLARSNQNLMSHVAAKSG